MLRDLEDETVAVRRFGLERIEDAGELSRELNVHDGADHRHDATTRAREVS